MNQSYKRLSIIVRNVIIPSSPSKYVIQHKKKIRGEKKGEREGEKGTPFSTK
jgi:hypothetical protein